MKGQFPWIGRSRGSAGGMTTAKINDKNIMRAKAFEVANPKTAAQVMQRDFFKQVQEVCSSVTKDQLRSLFGVKPKTMTRRNALSKQIAAAYTIEDGVKSVDFSKLLAIGNGEKVSTPFSTIVGSIPTDTTSLTSQMFGMPADKEFDVIAIVFNTDKMSILIIDLLQDFYEGLTYAEAVDFTDVCVNGYCYFTCATDGERIISKLDGSYVLKTRATD